MSGKVVAAGHICLDITPVFPETREYGRISELLVPGRLIHMSGVDVHTGGSVANTGIALKILGADVTLAGKVGDDAFGGMVRRIAASYGAGGLVVDSGCSTSYSVVLAVPGTDRIFLHDPGANDTFTGADITDDMLEDAVLFHFGYPPIMRKMYENDGEELVSMFRRVKEKEIATSLDFAAIDPGSDAGRADWETILRRVMPFTDFCVPSFEELCYMLDRPLYDRLSDGGGDMAEKADMERDAAPLAEKLLEMGAGAVLIKCGTKGMYYRTSGGDRIRGIGKRLGLDGDAWTDRAGIRRCFRPDRVLSGTGAGDVSIAAFLTAVLEGRRPDRAVALAAAEGACSVAAYDALSGLLSLRELEQRIDAGWETLPDGR